jgi:type II secretion system protein H
MGNRPLDCEPVQGGHQSAHGGFTLFEVLMVVLLISLTVTFAIAKLPNSGDTLARHEAERLAALVDQVREEVVLASRPIAIEIDEGQRSYRFLERDEEWTPVTGDDVLREHRLPDPLVLKIEHLQDQSDENTGLIVCDLLGELTPFSVVISSPEARYRVAVDDAQSISVTAISATP